MPGRPRQLQHEHLKLRLKRIRGYRRLTLGGLSRRAGLGGDSARLLERGDRVPGLDLVERLADALLVAPCFLSYGDYHGYEPALQPRHSGLADRLDRARRDMRLSAYQLARRSGVSLTTIRRLEDGLVVPRLDTVEKVAEVLRVRPGWLGYGCGTDEVGEPIWDRLLDSALRAEREQAMGGLDLWRRALWRRRLECEDFDVPLEGTAPLEM